jgi:hypothetical protein
MRNLINIVTEGSEHRSRADLYIFAAKGLFDSVFADKIECDLSEEGEQVVEIEHIVVIDHKERWETKGVSALCHLADKLGVTLTLSADDIADGQEDFFSQFDFSQVGGKMARRPEVSESIIDLSLLSDPEALIAHLLN